jgi:hypothetical protein
MTFDFNLFELWLRLKTMVVVQPAILITVCTDVSFAIEIECGVVNWHVWWLFLVLKDQFRNVYCFGAYIFQNYKSSVPVIGIKTSGRRAPLKVCEFVRAWRTYDTVRLHAHYNIVHRETFIYCNRYEK